jgi:Sigma-70, region 4
LTEQNSTHTFPMVDFWSLPDDILTIDNVRDDVDHSIFQIELSKLLLTLTHREQQVIHARFWDRLTLKESSKLLGITSERVRQIELKALRKFRHKKRQRILVDCGPSWIRDLMPKIKKRWDDEAKAIRDKYNAMIKGFDDRRKELERERLRQYEEYINAPHDEKCPQNVILEFTIDGKPYLATFREGGYFNRNMDQITYDRWLSQRLEENSKCGKVMI